MSGWSREHASNRARIGRIAIGSDDGGCLAENISLNGHDRIETVRDRHQFAFWVVATRNQSLLRGEINRPKVSSLSREDVCTGCGNIRDDFSLFDRHQTTGNPVFEKEDASAVGNQKAAVLLRTMHLSCCRAHLVDGCSRVGAAGTFLAAADPRERPVWRVKVDAGCADVPVGTNSREGAGRFPGNAAWQKSYTCGDLDLLDIMPVCMVDRKMDIPCRKLLARTICLKYIAKSGRCGKPALMCHYRPDPFYPNVVRRPPRVPEKCRNCSSIC
jgi:hypothetical protein